MRNIGKYYRNKKRLKEFEGYVHFAMCVAFAFGILLMMFLISLLL